jgi:hypothetical protein
MLDMAGDFPGVCTLKQQEHFAKICINPNLFLQSKYLSDFEGATQDLVNVNY